MADWQPVTEAETALRDALRADDQESYFRILVGVDLLLPVSTDAVAGRVPLGWGTWTTGGRTHVLAFTSAAALQACLADHAGSARQVTYRDLAANWPNLDWWLAVNPGLPIEGYLPAWFVAQSARGDFRLPVRRPANQPADTATPDDAAPAPDRAENVPAPGPSADDHAAPGGPAPLSPGAPSPAPPLEPPPAGVTAPAAAYPPAGVTASGLPRRVPGPGVMPPPGFNGPVHPAAPGTLPTDAGSGARQPTSAIPGPPSSGVAGSDVPVPGDLVSGDPVSGGSSSAASGPVVPEPALSVPRPVVPEPASSVPNAAVSEPAPFVPRPAPVPPAVPAAPAPLSAVPSPSPRSAPPVPGGPLPSGAAPGAIEPLPRRPVTPPSERPTSMAAAAQALAAQRPVDPAGSAASDQGRTDQGPTDQAPTDQGPTEQVPTVRSSTDQRSGEDRPAGARSARWGGAGAVVAPRASTPMVPVVPVMAEPADSEPPGSAKYEASVAGVSPVGPAVDEVQPITPAAPGPGRADDEADSSASAGPAAQVSPTAYTGSPASASTGAGSFASAPAGATQAGAGATQAGAGATQVGASGSPGYEPAAYPLSGEATPLAPGGPVPLGTDDHAVRDSRPQWETTRHPRSDSDRYAPPHADRYPGTDADRHARPEAVDRYARPSDAGAPAWNGVSGTFALPEGAGSAAEEEFVPANDTEAELFAAASDGSTDLYLSTLLLATVLVPVVADGLAGDGNVSLRTELIDGERYLVVFTSQERLGEHVTEPVRTRSIRFVNLIQNWPEPSWSFAVNPGGPIGATLPGSQVVALANWAAESGLGDASAAAAPTLPAGAQQRTPTQHHAPTQHEAPTRHEAPTQHEAATQHHAPTQHEAATRHEARTQHEAATQHEAPTRHQAATQHEVGGAQAADPPAGLPARTPTEPAPAGSAAPDSGVPVMQKVVPPLHLDYLLERGYDRVSGFVHRAAEVAHLRTPTELFDALGLDADAKEAYVLRWPAHRPNLYRIPYGGPTEAAMRAMDGWVIERAPFRGNGFTPGRSGDVVAEFKVDSVRLPHGAQLWRIDVTGAEQVVAVFDADAPRWRRIGED